jgi:hypothetical protein
MVPLQFHESSFWFFSMGPCRSTEDYLCLIIIVSEDAKSEPSHKYCRYYYPRSQPTPNSDA